MRYGYGSASYGTANVTSVSSEVVPANPNREFLHISNDGTAVVYLRFGTANAVATEGMRLAGGDSYEMNRGFGNVWSGAIQGITSTGTSKLTYIDGE